MTKLLQHVDELLRGRYTRREDLLNGRVGVESRTLVIVGLSLGAAYGLFMGIFAITRTGNPSYAQVAATMVKVPLLFLLTSFSAILPLCPNQMETTTSQTAKWKQSNVWKTKNFSNN